MTARRNYSALTIAVLCLGLVESFVSRRANYLLIPRSQFRRQGTGPSSSALILAASDDKSKADDEFWLKQKQLLSQMSSVANKSLQAEQREKFASRRLAFVSDTAYIGFFIFCSLWTVFDNPFVAFSYALGATLGLAYAYGLGKYVENLGGDPAESLDSPGSGVGNARLAFLLLLFVVVGKFRSSGLLEIPTIAGFFTYQLASLTQGFKQDVDD